MSFLKNLHICNKSLYCVKAQGTQRGRALNLPGHAVSPAPSEQAQPKLCNKNHNQKAAERTWAPSGTVAGSISFLETWCLSLVGDNKSKGQREQGGPLLCSILPVYPRKRGQRTGGWKEGSGPLGAVCSAPAYGSHFQHKHTGCA